MDKFNEDPLKYFEDYKEFFINPEKIRIEKEGKHKDIISLINDKVNLLWINIMSCSPNKKAFAN